MTDRRRGTQNVRTILLLMAVATAVYVAALGVYALFELEDPVRALRTGAEALAQEYDTLQVRTAALSRAFDGVEHLSRQTRLTQAQRSLGDSLRNGLEETARQSVGVQANLTLSNIPADMRVAFAEAARFESELAGTLLEALGDVNHGDFEAARASVSRAEADREALVGQLNRAQRLGLVDMADRQRVVETRADRLIRALTLWLVLGVVLAFLAAVLMSRRLFRPLRQFEEGLARVAQGDLEAALTVQRPDEMGRLHAHFNENDGRAAHAPRGGGPARFGGAIPVADRARHGPDLHPRSRREDPLLEPRHHSPAGVRGGRADGQERVRLRAPAGPNGGERRVRPGAGGG